VGNHLLVDKGPEALAEQFVLFFEQVTLHG
jgi:hypothetical protein